MFVYVWEYVIVENRRDDFLRYYEPEGIWARFFRNAPGYVRTELLQDAAAPRRFITIDHWRSRADRDAFQQANAEEFERIDLICEAFTRSESFLGDFTSAQIKRKK